MDNAWQVKCSSSWQSATPPSMPSSSQHPPQESRNQMEINAGRYFPTIAHEQRSAALGMIQEPLFSNTLNLGSYRSGHAELGNSFLALLSGPPSLLQCDLQQLLNPKPICTSNKLPVYSSSVTVSTAGSGVPHAPTGSLSENLGYQKPRSGMDFCPIVSSTTAVSTNCSSTSVLHDALQAANLNLQSSDLAKATIHHMVPRNEKVREFSSLKGGWPVNTGSANFGKLHGTNIHASQKRPSEASSSLCDHQATFTSGCPRVFCFGTSGDLLLSNTGLLGVVCLCHCWHMSVSKFCEHSELRDVNPGDAVRMDSGETIAQWRKQYFQKFGIRVPEDQSGWDWPEGISATAGFLKSSVTVPSLYKKSDLSHLVGSSGDLLRFEQPWDNVVFPKNPRTGQNSVNDVLHNKQWGNGSDRSNFLLKGSVGTSQSNLHALESNQIMESTRSRCSTMSKVVGRGGTDNDAQSISAYVDSISRSGTSFIYSPPLPNERTLGKDSDISRHNNSREGVILERDAVSSNIELRLGQPCQQSRTSRNSVLPVMGPRILDTLGDPQKSFFPEQLIHNTANSNVMEECRQYLQCATGTSNSSARREQIPFNCVNHTFEINNALDAAKLEQFRGDAAKSSVISMLLSHLTTPTEGNMQSKAINNVVNDNGHFVPRSLHFESHIAKRDPVYSPWNSANGLERESNINDLSFHRYMDKGKRVGFVTDGSYAATESTFGFYKQMGSSGTFTGVAGSDHPSSSAVHDKSCYSRQLLGMPPDASNASNSFNFSGKFSCLGSSGLDNVFVKSISPPMGSGINVPSQAVSTGFSSASSLSVPNLTPSLPTKESIGVSPYLLDENFKLLALRHILELSNREHAITSLGMNQKEGRFSSSSDPKVQGSVVDTLTSDELKHGLKLTSEQNASEVPLKLLQSGGNHRMGGDMEKLVPVADQNNWFDISTFTQGIPLCSKGIDSQDLPCEQPSLRLGRIENNALPDDHQKCCHGVVCTYFPGLCPCAVHTNCSAVNCDSKGKTSLSAFKEQMGGMNGKPSMLFTTRFHKDHIVQKEKNISFHQNEKSKGQNHKKIDCHASQWKDVPSKVIVSCDMKCVRPSVDGLGGRKNDEDQLADTAAKRFNGNLQEINCLKEQEMSNISSGCSAPAVTQASIEVNNMDSCTVDAGDTGCANDLVVDEASGIEKCWSSDDALDSERSAEFLGFTCKTSFIKEGSSKALANQSSRSLIDELKFRDSFRWKRVRNESHTGLAIHEKNSHSPKIERGLKTRKRKKTMKMKMLNASFPASGFSSGHYEHTECAGSAEWRSFSYKDVDTLLQCELGTSHTCGACTIGPSFKRRRSTLSSAKNFSRKRDVDKIYADREGEDGYQAQSKGKTEFLSIHEVSGAKRIGPDRTAEAFRQFCMQEPSHTKAVKYNSVGCVKESSCLKLDVSNRREKPVVCGKYGVISNGKLAIDVPKPAKIFSLSRVLKTARRCTLSANDEPRLTSMRQLKKARLRGSNGCVNEISNLMKEKENEIQNATRCDERNPDNSMEEAEKAVISGDTRCADELLMSKQEKAYGSKKDDSYHSTRLKRKYKEIRKRSLYELTGKGKSPSSGNAFVKIPKHAPQKKSGSVGLENAEDSKHSMSESYKVNSKKSIKEHRFESFISDTDAFCCVCGSSNKDEINCLLECSRCLIRVHQACYGVSRVPKGRWYCRPCRTSSKNIVCVLCGYGGGAMTRALRTRNIVKSLLKVWNIETESWPKSSVPPEALQDKLGTLDSSRSGLENESFPVLRPLDIEPSTTTAWNMDLQNRSDITKNLSCSLGNLKIHNTITAGILDSTVKQWVHMVCGLWTPGTRCPNVDTMSAFDVSGASRPRANVICSICNRPGGSCIKCRVLNCLVPFHPWCAHRKGLLQSEVEGVDNENVGFYGRCMLHAAHPSCELDSDPINIETDSTGEKELTCARTEGYKGRKQEGFRHNLNFQSNGNGGCLVPQEQLNAWLHINGQKSCTKGLPKTPISDVEYDCRKEFARYKQAKGWKHLVVYKSGIHALGLYTSRFISRGAMVVEYVGEIVGLRVADKRESDYQSGRKLQYKTACYFFRIDKEHIIDATRKGGIARFVNHSCLPNCVAKVISVRNEKKVVFFAERDINPGEEITYDYHFNHEDEGKKIPCFCNSRNCRRYLN
ncbi:uncharacterized protein LOC100255892 isoform X4 [Vitis vinifera]|uniref:uncharacterized protein LOC100255892 isoform X4 n=1 Tax=Vitis vinifera TaxID=29760 RepID=UPI002882F530|nr:uncharacterized protein LOC100255892 isoform X4 [Vitis vinifera]